MKSFQERIRPRFIERRCAKFELKAVRYRAKVRKINFNDLLQPPFVKLKPIEFDKGKTAVSVSALDKLPPVIDTLIAAVRSGELDDQMAQMSKQRVVPKARKP